MTQNECRYAILKMFVEDQELYKLYSDKVEYHNRIVKNNVYSLPGFQLINPKHLNILESSSTRINMKIRCSMKMDVDYSNSYRETPFYLYPDASIPSTPLRLSTGVSIIPNGFRDSISVTFDNIFKHKYDLEKHTKILQICSPDLRPIVVVLVDDVCDLGNEEQ